MKKNIDIKWFDKKFSPAEKAVLDTLFREKIPDDCASCDEDEFVGFAGKNGVSSLIYKKISAGKKNVFPDSLLSKLKNDYLRTLVFNTNILKKALEINTVLDNEGISVVFLKGILLAPFVYKDVALRPMSDIDFLIPDKDVKKAYDVLISKGAVPADPVEKDNPDNHHLPMIIFNGAPVEVHRSLSPKETDFYIPPEEMFNKKATWRNGDISLPGPAHFHLFIYMMVHVYYSFLQGGMRLSWMYDFYMFLKRDNFSIDIESEEFVETVREWGVGYPVRFILTLLDLLSGKEPATAKWNEDKKLVQDLSLAAGFFREMPEDSVLYSYRLVWEQIRNTKGMKNKLRIFKTKLYRRSDEKLPGRLSKLAGRFSGMFYNSLKLKLRRLFGRF